MTHTQRRRPGQDGATRPRTRPREGITTIMTTIEPTGEHQLAAMFPLLAGNTPEFNALVADIKANGLLEPVVLTDDGLVLDGRNRLRACKKAGVEPTFVVYSSGDPWAFVISRNIQRRHLNAGQRAIIVTRALLSNDHEPLYRNTDLDRTAKLAGVSRPSISQAKKLLENNNSALIQEVEKGDRSLSSAYDEILAEEKNRQQERDWERNRLDDLKLFHKDLYQEVQSGQTSLKDAAAIAFDRDDKADEKQEREDRAFDRRQRRFAKEMEEKTETPAPPSLPERIDELVEQGMTPSTAFKQAKTENGAKPERPAQTELREHALRAVAQLAARALARLAADGPAADLTEELLGLEHAVKAARAADDQHDKGAP